MPVRMEKFLTQLMKINQSVNLPSNNKITEIQKIFENSVVTDPSLE
jgi:16S rRNA G527 N7-methylase RsmG